MDYPKDMAKQVVQFYKTTFDNSFSTMVMLQEQANLKDMGEEAKISIRNVRRDANKEIDALEKDKEISEDEAYAAKEEVQKSTKDSETKVDEVVTKKTQEIMTF